MTQPPIDLAPLAADALLADPGTVDALGPNQQLATALMRMKGRLSPAAADGLRTLIARVVAEIVRCRGREGCWRHRFDGREDAGDVVVRAAGGA